MIAFAGDLAPYAEGQIARLADEWKSAREIVFVPGNVDFFGADLEETRLRLSRECKDVGISLLDQGSVEIEDLKIIGATLWTDVQLFLHEVFLSPEQAMSLQRATIRAEITDFSGKIRCEGRSFSIAESVKRHRADLSFLVGKLEQARLARQHTVVVTHHAPSPFSIPRRGKGWGAGAAYASNLHQVIYDYQPAVWIHAGTRGGTDHQRGQTRIIANPAWKGRRPAREFKPDLFVDVIQR